MERRAPLLAPAGVLVRAWMWGCRLLSALLYPLAPWNIRRSLDRIAELSAGRGVPDLVAAVRTESARLAPAGRLAAFRLRLAWPLLSRRHAAAGRNPCLYLAMLGLALENNAGRQAELNVLVSGDQAEPAAGHCWLTRQGRLLHGASGPEGDCEAAPMGRGDGVVYWWRKGEGVADALHGGQRPAVPGRESWPT